MSMAAAVRLLRGRSWSRLILLSGAAVASLVSMRYVYFFAPLAVATLPAAFAGGRVQVRGDKPGKLSSARVQLPAFIMLLTLAFTIAFTYHKVNFRGLLKSETAYGLFPEQAAEYVLSGGIPQPIFNDITWGGFLIYRLWPEYKVFADTRTLNIDIYRQYMNVLNDTAEGGAILRAYGIKSIITPAINPYTGEIFPLVRGLMVNDDWALVYLDGVAMIFVRKEYATRALPKAAVYEQVYREVASRAPSFPGVPGYRRTLDEARKALGGGGGMP
jgi:hypothetical protein